MTRPVPTLDARHVTETRAEGFDQFEQMVERVLAMTAPDDRAQAATLRWLKLFGVALVEGLRAEETRGEADLISAPLRALGYMTLSLHASRCRADAPLRKLAHLLSDEFGLGARLAADQIREANPE